MSMKQYEYRRENLWKDAYKDDPAFEAGDTPVAKVHSFFVKRHPNEPEVKIGVAKEKSVEYDRTVSVEWLEERLNHVLRYKRKWYGDQDVYKYAALQDYLDQCKKGGYKGALLSVQELAMLLPPKKKEEKEFSFY